MWRFLGVFERHTQARFTVRVFMMVSSGSCLSAHLISGHGGAGGPDVFAAAMDYAVADEAS